ALVRQTQPAAYLKVLALLVPREHKVEHSNVIKSLSDQELEAMVEYLQTLLEPQAGGSVRVIEGSIEPAAATAHAPKPKNRLMLEADTAVGSRERTTKGPPGRGSHDLSPRRGALRLGLCAARWISSFDGNVGPRILSGLLGPSTTLIPPKILEAVGRHFGVPDRVLDVLVPEVVLQGSRVVAIVGEPEPAGVAKHVWVDREWHLGGLAEALDEPVEADGADWSAALGDEYVGVLRVLAS